MSLKACLLLTSVLWRPRLHPDGPGGPPCPGLRSVSMLPHLHLLSIDSASPGLLLGVFECVCCLLSGRSLTGSSVQSGGTAVSVRPPEMHTCFSHDDYVKGASVNALAASAEKPQPSRRDPDCASPRARPLLAAGGCPHPPRSVFVAQPRGA